MQKKSSLPICIVVTLLILGCAGAPPVPEKVAFGPGTVVAVWELEDLSTSKSDSVNLGEFITPTIIEALENRCKFQIVEREKLILALEELSLGSSETANESTRLQIGKLLGARLMVFGAYQDIGKLTRLDLRMVDTESGRVVKVASSEVKAHQLDNRLNGAKQAATELCSVP